MTTPAAEELRPGFIRTATPFLVGLLGSWLTRQGLDINDDLLAAGLVAVYGYAYYVVARLGEVYGSSRWSYILGFSKKKPGYVEPPDEVFVPEAGREPEDDVVEARHAAPGPLIKGDPVVGPRKRRR